MRELVRILAALLLSASCWAQAGRGAPEETTRLAREPLLMELIGQAALAANASTPKNVAPTVLITLGEATAPCDVDLATNYVTQGFKAALAMRPIDDTTETACLRALRWLSSASRDYNRPKLLQAALALASEIDFKSHSIGRQRAFEPMLRVLVQERNTDAISTILTSVEYGDAKFPFHLSKLSLRALTDPPTLDAMLLRGYGALARGQVRTLEDLEFVEQTIDLVSKPIAVESLTTFLKLAADPETGIDACVVHKATGLLHSIAPSRKPPNPVSSCVKSSPPGDHSPIEQGSDPVSEAYEDILRGAESDSALLAQALLRVPDVKTRKAMMLSAMQRLRAQGLTAAADRVANALNSLMPADSLQKNPAELIMLARSTPPGDARDALVRRALSLAENLIREDNASYEEASSDADKLNAYRRSSQESIATYALAARSFLPLASESALRTSGPQRADALTVVIESACRAQ